MMKDDKTNSKNAVKNEKTTNRRALLRGIVAGSAVVTGSKALPETWTKPITDAVILPSHARTTTDYGGGDQGDTGPYGGEPGSLQDEEDTNQEADEELDFNYGDSEGDYTGDDDSGSGDKYNSNYDEV